MADVNDEKHETLASSIEFNNTAQLWEVKGADGGLLFSHASRQTCLDWEHQYFNR